MTILAELNANTLTRLQLATALESNSAVLDRVATAYFVALMGRQPVRNPDPALDELTPLVALLQLPPTPGQLSGDQRLLLALVTSSEYLQIHGDNNSAWLKSIYLTVLGRTTIDTSTATGTEFNGVLNTLLSDYTPARQTVLSDLIGSQEYRDQVYTQDYNQLLGRLPTAAELSAAETTYQTYGQRLELIPAVITSTSEYYPLAASGSSNSAWLSKVYQALLGRGTTNDPVAAQQLATLDNTPAAGLANARLTIAYQIQNTTEYRTDWITGVYEKYLNRAPTTTDLNFWLAGMAAATDPYTQQDVLILLLRMPEYFIDHAL
jgi:hypothetical protein